MAETEVNFEVMDFHSRVLDQEPDTIQIIPVAPEYVIIGTYNLQKRETSGNDTGTEEMESSSSTQRNGSLQILPLDHINFNTNHTPVSSIWTRKDFDCAIVDLHFHPEDRSLLGVATSTAEIRFFRILVQDVPSENKSEFTILDIGHVKVVEESDDTTALPLITYFCWFHEISSEGDDNVTVTLAACDAQGNSNIIRASFSAFKNSDDVSSIKRARESSTVLECQIRHIHKQQHGLEAWVLAFIPLQSPRTETLTKSSAQPYLLLTGGDDANIIASTFNLNETSIDENNLVSNVTRQFVLRNQHEAGVIFILPLPLPALDTSFDNSNASTGSMTVPILTGSYDDHLRLFLLQLATEQGEGRISQPKLQTSINLSGGVWRVIVLDSYRSQSSTTVLQQEEQRFNDTKTESQANQWNWVLLVCTMYNGAKIVRLSMTDPAAEHQILCSMITSTPTKDIMSSLSIPSGTPSASANSTSTTTPKIPSGGHTGEKFARCEWKFKIEATFQKGHESMVYAAAAKYVPSTDTSTIALEATTATRIPLIANDNNSNHYYHQHYHQGGHEHHQAIVNAPTSTVKSNKSVQRFVSRLSETISDQQQQQQQPQNEIVGQQGYNNDDDDDNDNNNNNNETIIHKDKIRKGRPRTWKIISTSFYDRKVCNWTWIDDDYEEEEEEDD